MVWDVTTADRDGVSPTNTAARGSEMTTNSGNRGNFSGGFTTAGFETNSPGDYQVYFEFSVSPLNPEEVISFESISFSVFSSRSKSSGKLNCDNPKIGTIICGTIICASGPAGEGEERGLQGWDGGSV